MGGGGGGGAANDTRSLPLAFSLDLSLALSIDGREIREITGVYKEGVGGEGEWGKRVNGGKSKRDKGVEGHESESVLTTHTLSHNNTPTRLRCNTPFPPELSTQQ